MPPTDPSIECCSGQSLEKLSVTFALVGSQWKHLLLSHLPWVSLDKERCTLIFSLCFYLTSHKHLFNMYGQVFSDLNEALKKFKAFEQATGTSLQFFETLIWQTGLIVGFRSELVSMYVILLPIMNHPSPPPKWLFLVGTEHWLQLEAAHSTLNSSRVCQPYRNNLHWAWITCCLTMSRTTSCMYPPPYYHVKFLI